MSFISKPMSIQLSTVRTGASVDISTSDGEICYITGWLAPFCEAF